MCSIDEPPIVLLAFPRTGSSMIAGIFARHGVFAGKCNDPSPVLPTGDLENKQIKEFLKSAFPLSLDAPVEPEKGFREAIERIMLADGYIGGPWMVKHAAIYWPAWFEFGKVKYVGIRRNAESVATSNRAWNMAPRFSRDIENAYRVALDQLDYLHAAEGAPIVEADAVVRGDYQSLEKAFEYCGLSFNRAVADDLINPDHWHF